MKKALKIGLWSLLALFVVVAIAISYIAATFDANAYKAQAIKLVKEEKQRTLKLDGDIKLTFFPSLGARLEKISLSERNSETEFAAIDSAHVAVALLPLFSGRLVVDEVGLSGAKVQVVKYKDGHNNYDDLLGEGKPAEAPRETPAQAKPSAGLAFDIAAIKVENTQLAYRDEGKGTQYALKDVNLKTGRIANGLPCKIDLSAVIQANEPKVDISTQLQTILTFDLAQMRYQVEALDLQVKGSVLDISNLDLSASGDASANLTTQEYTARKLQLAASGLKGKDKFDSKVNVPELSLTHDKFSADKVTLKAHLDGAVGNVDAALALLDMQGNAQSFKSNALTIDVDLKQPEQAFKLNLSTPLAGSVEAKQINLSDLVLKLGATGDKLPNKSLSSEMKGKLQLDAGRQSMLLELAGGLLQSQIKAKLAVNNFTNPAIRYDLDIDQLDADLYLPKKQAAEAKARATAAPEQPFDLSGLQKLNVEGSVRVGKLKVMNVQSSQLRVDVKAHNGLVNVSPIAAKLYQGSVDGSITLNAAQKVPSVAIRQSLDGVVIGPLLKDAVNLDMLDGKGDVNLNITTQGNTVSALKKALNGSAGVSLADGAVKGINIAKKLREFGGRGGDQTESANKAEKTDFSEMKASFKIKNGVAHNEDLSLKSPLLRVSGKGDVDIGNDRIDYLTKATLAGTLEGQGGRDVVGGLTVPVRLSGPYTDLKYKFEFGSLISDTAKQKVESKKEELKEKLQDRFKGLLNR
ncbi:MAG TPA: AsmA family protein [Gallionellaceae bacterium]